jgi:hypothetical protein
VFRVSVIVLNPLRREALVQLEKGFQDRIEPEPPLSPMLYVLAVDVAHLLTATGRLDLEDLWARLRSHYGFVCKREDFYHACTLVGEVNEEC